MGHIQLKQQQAENSGKRPFHHLLCTHTQTHARATVSNNIVTVCWPCLSPASSKAGSPPYPGPIRADYIRIGSHLNICSYDIVAIELRLVVGQQIIVFILLRL